MFFFCFYVVYLALSLLYYYVLILSPYFRGSPYTKSWHSWSPLKSIIALKTAAKSAFYLMFSCIFCIVDCLNPALPLWWQYCNKHWVIVVSLIVVCTKPGCRWTFACRTQGVGWTAAEQVQVGKNVFRRQRRRSWLIRCVPDISWRHHCTATSSRRTWTSSQSTPWSRFQNGPPWLSLIK